MLLKGTYQVIFTIKLLFSNSSKGSKPDEDLSLGVVDGVQFINKV